MNTESEKDSGVWVSEKEIHGHMKSIGKPDYDNASQSSKGKTEFFEKLSETANVVVDKKSTDLIPGEGTEVPFSQG